MPNHRNEPNIYSGKILMMSGADMGNLVPTPYKVAQGLVASGQARWEGDDSPMPRHIASIISKREEDAARLKAEDSAINANKLAGYEQKTQTTDRSGARPLGILQRGDTVYLARPFPSVIEITPELINDETHVGFTRKDDDMIAIVFPNAEAIYRDVTLPGDAFIYAELVEVAKAPDVDIPDDWRGRSHLQNIPAAKELLHLDRGEKMTKAEAEEIIEQWTKVDDQVPAEDGNGNGASEPPRNENGRILDGEQAPEIDEDGNKAKTPEEIAEEQERKFVEDDGF